MSVQDALYDAARRGRVYWEFAELGGNMKLAKLMVWGCGVLAVAVFTYFWHRYSGWYDWARFPKGSEADFPKDQRTLLHAGCIS